jgi:hypothetical protein
MANFLGDEKKHQVLALGRLGWPLRRIEHATGVRRETASAYLKAAGITIRDPRQRRPPAKPASQVSTDPANPASEVSTDLAALPPGLLAPSPWPPPASRAPTASACEPYRDLIELALERGRNAMAIWQVSRSQTSGTRLTTTWSQGVGRAGGPGRPRETVPLRRPTDGEDHQGSRHLVTIVVCNR